MENKSIKKPEIVVFAGPNGSGKSTITNLLRPPMLPYINADEIQRVLDCDNMEAAKIAENRREECLEKCKGFCFETVLSTDRNLKLLKRAKDAGFFIRCYYVLTADPQINVARVASRVSAGGHDVPTDKIISRYHKALPRCFACCSFCAFLLCFLSGTICFIGENTSIVSNGLDFLCASYFIFCWNVYHTHNCKAYIRVRLIAADRSSSP